MVRQNARLRQLLRARAAVRRAHAPADVRIAA
jgi:hypothetical protein